MVFVILYFLDDLVEEIVEKFVGVLMHGAAEELIAITELVDECTGSYGALIRRVFGNVHVEGTERREESRWCSGDDGSGGSGSGKLVGNNLSTFGFPTRDGDSAC